jgi:protein-S-isoprenylcysteine O-methyltransferase Ste14
MGQTRNDFIVRTLIWLAVIALWAFLNKPVGDSILAIQAGLPTLLGLSLVVGGICLYIWSAQLLAGGAPITKYEPAALLTRGPYRHVRNPLYLSIAMVLAGVSALYRAWSLGHLVRYGLVALGAHLLVVMVEEPATRKHLGSAYEEYCRLVPRWIPRFRGASPGAHSH